MISKETIVETVIGLVLAGLILTFILWLWRWPYAFVSAMVKRRRTFGVTSQREPIDRPPEEQHIRTLLKKIVITEPETELRLIAKFRRHTKIQRWNIRFVTKPSKLWPRIRWWPGHSLTPNLVGGWVNANPEHISIFKVEQHDLSKQSRREGYEAVPKRDEAGGWFVDFGNKPYEREDEDGEREMVLRVHVRAPIAWKGHISLRVTTIEQHGKELVIYHRLPVAAVQPTG